MRKYTVRGIAGWAAINCAFCAMIYVGATMLPFVGNLVTLLCLVLFFAYGALSVAPKKYLKTVFYDKGVRHLGEVPRNFDVVYDSIIVVVLFALGWFGAGTLYAIANLVFLGALEGRYTAFVKEIEEEK